MHKGNRSIQKNYELTKNKNNPSRFINFSLFLSFNFILSQSPKGEEGHRADKKGQ